MENKIPYHKRKDVKKRNAERMKKKYHNMTDEEKEKYPTYETTGGYLKVLDESESAQIWWDGLTEGAKNTIKSLPNFDAEIFRKCTGIRVK